MSIEGAFQAAVMGAVSGVVTFGIGQAFQGLKFAAKATYSALAHGIFQGMISEAQGGYFAVGFASGAISSIASSAIDLASTGTNFDGTKCVTEFGAVMNKPIPMLITGGIMGGAGARLSGGNFWQGAVTGLVVSGLNHYLHRPPTTGPVLLKASLELADYFDYNGDGSLSLLEGLAGVADVAATIGDILTVPSGEGVAAHLGLKASFKLAAKQTMKNTFKGVSEKQLKNWGIKDIHKFKELALGTNKNLSKFDVVKNTTTHELMIIVKETQKIVTGTGKYVK